MSAKFGTMRAAADALGVAPSSVSRQIAQMETFLHAPLVEKNSHTVRLTEIGRLVVDHYRDRLAEKEVLLARLADLKGVRSGQYTLAVDNGLIGPVITAGLQSFRMQCPGISLDVLVGSTEEVIAMVCEDNAHVGMVFDVPPDPRLRLKLTVGQPLAAICAPAHPLAGRASIGLAELAAYPFILPLGALRVWKLLLAANPQGIQAELSPCFRTNSVVVMREFARTGVGISVLPELPVADDLDAGRLRAVSIVEPILRATKTDVITRLGRELPPGGNALLHVLARALARWRVADKPGRAQHA
jgi:DNA-binding transcriptional LysR family regulator